MADPESQNMYRRSVGIGWTVHENLRRLGGKKTGLIAVKGDEAGFQPGHKKAKHAEFTNLDNQVVTSWTRPSFLFSGESGLRR
jgi:hypothetical protein